MKGEEKKADQLGMGGAHGDIGGQYLGCSFCLICSKLGTEGATKSEMPIGKDQRKYNKNNPKPKAYSPQQKENGSL